MTPSDHESSRAEYKKNGGKTVAQSAVEMTEIVLPQHTNALGSAFGGTIMAWIDVAAAIVALRHAGKQVVTASVDALQFVAPVKLGWVISIKAACNFVGTSSCEVGVKVIAENPITGEFFHTASAYLTLVALDSNGRPTKMPPLIATSEDEIRRFEHAKMRRTARLKLKEEFQSRLNAKASS